jgi:hypothetical protein
MATLNRRFTDAVDTAFDAPLRAFAGRWPCARRGMRCRTDLPSSHRCTLRRTDPVVTLPSCGPESALEHRRTQPATAGFAASRNGGQPCNLMRSQISSPR